MDEKWPYATRWAAHVMCSSSLCHGSLRGEDQGYLLGVGAPSRPVCSAQVWVNYQNYNLGATPKVRALMEFSGNQLRAARALLGLDQETLAKHIGVSDNTIRNMEACGAHLVRGFASTRAKVHRALEALGIEFTNGNEPGVKLRVRAKGKSKCP